MKFWENEMVKITGCDEIEAAEVLQIMQCDVLNYASIGNISRARLVKAAKEAFRFYKFSQTDEGKAIMAAAEKEVLA